PAAERGLALTAAMHTDPEALPPEVSPESARTAVLLQHPIDAAVERAEIAPDFPLVHEVAKQRLGHEIETNQFREPDPEIVVLEARQSLVEGARPLQSFALHDDARRASDDVGLEDFPGHVPSGRGDLLSHETPAVAVHDEIARVDQARSFA